MALDKIAEDAPLVPPNYRQFACFLKLRFRREWQCIFLTWLKVASAMLGGNKFLNKNKREVEFLLYKLLKRETNFVLP